MGLVKTIIYTYSLKNLKQVQKQSFSHALYGTGGRESFLITVKGRRLGKNSILIPSRYADNFERFLNAWKADFKKLEVFIEGDTIEY